LCAGKINAEMWYVLCQNVEKTHQLKYKATGHINKALNTTLL